MDLDVALLTYRDVGLIETNHATQDGRTTNVYVPTKKSGDSSHAGAGSTKGCLGVQSENQKNVAIEPEKEPYFNPNALLSFHRPQNTEVTVPDKGAR